MDTTKPRHADRAFHPVWREWHNLYSPPSGLCGSGDCADCLEQFRTLEWQRGDAYMYADGLSIAEATRICASYTKDIQDDLVYLRTKVASHGDTILSRWKKKSREKRSALILKAFPSIFPKQWAQFNLNYDTDGWQYRRPFREAILLPYLNLEILRDDASKFLALLYHRTKFDPQDWAIFDKDQTRTAFAGGGLRVEFAECCVVLHGLNYGNVVPWDTAKVHRWDIAGFPRGRIILEGQHNLMRFLRLGVQDILDGVGQDGSSDKWNQLPMTGFQTVAGVESWSRFANQAFSPPGFDIDRLISIAKARVSETEDHLWLLQTDVAYFQFQAKNITQGRMFKEFGKLVGDMTAAFDIWMTPMDHLVGWQYIVEELEYTRTLYLRFRDSIQLGERLPPKFEHALASLELLLVTDIQNFRSKLAQLIPSMVGFQDYYMFRSAPPQMKLDPRKVTTTGDLYYKDPLFWCLHQMMADSQDPRMFDGGLLFGFLDDWLSKDSTTANDRARLNQNLLFELSNLATAHEVLSAVRQHRPRSKPITLAEAKLKGADRPVWRNITATDGRIFDYSMENKKALVKLLKAVQADLFPTGRRDSQWLEHAKQVRQKVGDFWAKTRELHAKVLTRSRPWTEEQMQQKLAALSFDRTPEHITAVEDERQAVLACIQRLASSRSLAKTNSSGASFEFPTTETSTFELPLRPKLKIKSRPEGSSINKNTPEQESDEDQINSEEPLSPIPQINVKPESLRVFSRMFPLTPEEHSAKALDWQMFVRAMEDVGFSAEQSGGSAVAFIKEGAGRIVFHKPHPVPKIEQMMLQTWGKRMGKWFRWKRDLFVSEKSEFAP